MPNSILQYTVFCGFLFSLRRPPMGHPGQVRQGGVGSTFSYGDPRRHRPGRTARQIRNDLQVEETHRQGNR